MHLKEPYVRGPYKRDELYWSTNEVKELTQEKSRKLQQKAFNVSIQSLLHSTLLARGYERVFEEVEKSVAGFLWKEGLSYHTSFGTHCVISAGPSDKSTRKWGIMFFTLGEQECFYCGLFTWRIHLLLVRNIQQKAFAVSIPSSFQVARERYSKKLRRYLQVYYEKRNCRVTIRYFGTHGVIGV